MLFEIAAPTRGVAWREETVVNEERLISSSSRPQRKIACYLIVRPTIVPAESAFIDLERDCPVGIVVEPEPKIIFVRARHDADAAVGRVGA